MINIIVVEDDVRLNNLICLVLERHNYYVDGVNNPLEALKKMENNSYNLIISDIMMPEMNGFEFAKTIRLTNKDIPILFISAKGEYEDKKGLRPNISVSDLQHYDKEARTALLLSGRLLPFETTLPDIDDFSEKVDSVQFTIRQKAEKISLDFKFEEPKLSDSEFEDEMSEETRAERRAYLERRRQELIARMQKEMEEEQDESDSDKGDEASDDQQGSETDEETDDDFDEKDTTEE